jgi:hypothetical protein
MASEKESPQITPVEWLPARDVPGGEASDSTPWLHQNLHALGTALTLEDLTADEMEQNVLGKRLDILATAVRAKVSLRVFGLTRRGRGGDRRPRVTTDHGCHTPSLARD